MSKFLSVALIGLFLSAGGTARPALAQIMSAQTREVVGSVHDAHGSPIKGANVQIENQDTHAVQSYLTDADGSFHFIRLSKDTDYEVSASFQGASSKKVSVSKFDDKASKFVKLVVDR